MPTDDCDWEHYIDNAGKGPRLPVQAKDLLYGISSQNLRSLLVAAPGDIPEEFGCSPEEAAVALACCELAELPAWDEAALIDAAVVGGIEEERVMWGCESRDLVARCISLAMKAEKAPEVMSPAAGVLLLRRAGINVFHQLLDAVAWLQLGSDATLHNYRLLKGIPEPYQTAPATDTATPAPVVAVGASDGVQPDKAGPAKPLQRAAAQDSAILCEIEKLGYDPLALPKNLPGKPGVKAAIRAALSQNPLFTGGRVFDKAWERLTARADIAIQG